MQHQHQQHQHQHQQQQQLQHQQLDYEDDSDSDRSGGRSQRGQQSAQQIGTVQLYGASIVSLQLDGEERLCLAQISNTLLKAFSYNEIHNRRVALGITCVQCTPVQLELLRRAGAMPVSSRRCGMITRREAERLVKSFLDDVTVPQLPETFSFDVSHSCGWGCRGYFYPSRYTSSRAKCIRCHHCQQFLSPNKFIFHCHQVDGRSYRQPDAANFNAWRRHLGLTDPAPDRDLLYNWEDVKAMFNGGSRRRGPGSAGGPAGDGANDDDDDRDGGDYDEPVRDGDAEHDDSSPIVKSELDNIPKMGKPTGTGRSRHSAAVKRSHSSMLSMPNLQPPPLPPPPPPPPPQSALPPLPPLPLSTMIPNLANNNLPQSPLDPWFHHHHQQQQQQAQHAASPAVAAAAAAAAAATWPLMWAKGLPVGWGDRQQQQQQQQQQPFWGYNALPFPPPAVLYQQQQQQQQIYRQLSAIRAPLINAKRCQVVGGAGGGSGGSAGYSIEAIMGAAADDGESNP